MTSTSSHQQYLGLSYFPALDGLRTLCIVPIIWHHSAQTPLPGLLGKGPIGVQLFFALSGFLVTTLLLREKQLRGSISLSRFFMRRSLRIFPLYYLTLSAVSLHSVLSPESAQRQHFFDSLPFYATYTSNWWVDWQVSHPITFAYAWTLAVEEQFYLFWPPLVALCTRRLATASMVVLLALSQLHSGELLSLNQDGGFLGTFCQGLSSSIALGSLLALALHSPLSFALCSRALRAPWAVALYFTLTLLCILQHAPSLVLNGALVLLVGAAAWSDKGPLLWLLQRPAMLWVGRRSYTLYLTHIAAISAVRLLIPPENYTRVFLFSLALALILAAVIYRTVEQPILRFKERYSSRSQSRIGAASPVRP